MTKLFITRNTYAKGLHAAKFRGFRGYTPTMFLIDIEK